MATEHHLLVVIDPTQTVHPSLEAVMAWAKKTPERMKLTFLLIASDQTRKNVDLTYMTCSGDWVKDTIYQPLADLGCEFNVLISWSRDWSETLIELEVQLDIDLTIIPYYEGVSADILSEENWKLLRKSQHPILIARHKPDGFEPRILAAVKDQDERFEERNTRVLSAGKQLAEDFNLDLHIVNAYSDSMNFPDRTRISNTTGVANENVHVKIGEPAAVIKEVASEINAGMVIVSSHKRSGLQGMLRGNTVEKIMGGVGRDILMV